MQNNKLIRKIIEQFFTDEFVIDLIKYIVNIEYNETNTTKLKLLSDILSEIDKQLIEQELTRVKKLINELKQSLNDNLLFSENIDIIRDNITQLEQYRKFLKQIQKKIEQIKNIIRMKLSYIEKEILLEELEELQDKLEMIFGIEDINDITNIDDINKFSTQVETKIKQLNIKWTELKTVLDTLMRYETLITKISIGQESNESLTELIKQIQEYAQQTTIELTKLYISEDLADEGNGNKKLFDRLSLIQATDEYITDEVSKFINQNYSSFDTGLTIFDDRLNGIESGSVYLIAAPTNHGKTLFLIQTLYSIIVSNINQFNEKDAILFVTLEDSNIKVLNRIYSVFGNFQYKHLTQLQKNFKLLSEYIKVRYPEKIEEFKKFVKDTYSFIKSNSIDKITNGKVEIFVQDARERKNDYSVVDIITTIEQLKTLGYNIRAIFIDYIELMSSTKKYEKEYSEQGQVIIDLRNLANTYMIPIIAATQLNRTAEDSSVELTNQVMGDSYNKARFSDYVIMIRQIKTDIGIIPNEMNDNEDKKRGRKKKKEHPDITEVIRSLMPISETQTRIKDLVQTNYKNAEFPNFKKLLYNNKFNNNNNNNVNQNLVTPTAPLNLFKQHQIRPQESNITDETLTDDIFTDGKIITNLFRLVEYNIPKAKDGINIPSCSELVNTIREKIGLQYPELQNKIEYHTNYILDKELIYPNSRYTLQPSCQLNNNYILFSKFNLRVYSIPEIPLAIYDYLQSLENFNKLNQFLLKSELYQKVLNEHGL